MAFRFMTTAQKDEAKRRGNPLLLILLGALVTMVGIGSGVYLVALFGLFCIAIGILGSKENAKNDAIARKKKSEQAEIDAYWLRKARGEED